MSPKQQDRACHTTKFYCISTWSQLRQANKTINSVFPFRSDTNRSIIRNTPRRKKYLLSFVCGSLVESSSNDQKNISRKEGSRSVRTGGVELVLAGSSAETPVLLVHGLAVVTNAVGLPGLIIGLEVEQVNTPGEHTTDTSLPEGLGISGTSLSSLIIRATI